MREVLLSTAVKHQSRAIAQSTNCETQKKGRALLVWQTNEMNGREFGIGANMPVANRIVRPPCPLSRSRPALSLSHSGSSCPCPGLHPAPHTLTLLNTTHGGRCNSSSRAGAAAADVQHLADAGPLHPCLIAGCSAVAGSMELIRWTGTPRRWSYWQCSIGQHRRCCCRCSSGRSQYFL